MFKRIKGWFSRKSKPEQDVSAGKKDQSKLSKKFSEIKTAEILAALKEHANSDPRMKVIERYNTIVGGKIKKPKLFPGVVPKEAKNDKVYMATDSNITDVCAYAAQVCKCNGFPGYGFLAELTQYSEYRSPSETTSKEMVRKWVKIKSSGSDEQSSKKVEEITQALTTFGVKELFEQAALNDGQFGNCFIYIKLNYGDADQEKHDMEPLLVTKETITKGMLDSFKIIEPIWVTPYEYNSTDPKAKDFYKPSMWWVMSSKIHATRMLQFVSRPVPDLLKPVYNFGGMSMTQLIIHYVEAWYRTRNSVNDMISSFSMSGIKTDLSSDTSGVEGIDVPKLVNRAGMYTLMKDNQGLLLLDKDEEFFNFNIPLSGLDALQAQSQEHMAAPTHTPLVKLNGITPTGLNSNSDGEIQVYYDYISSMQSTLFGTNFKTVLDIIQLHLYGEIDQSITFSFNPLEESSDLENSQQRKSDAETDAILVTTGIISIEESRSRIANDPNTNYGGLDVDKLPPPPPNMYEGNGYGSEENYTSI